MCLCSAYLSVCVYLSVSISVSISVMQVVLLISGGTGATPLMGVRTHLLAQAAAGKRKMRKVRVVRYRDG
jgi:hypothetical protein